MRVLCIAAVLLCMPLHLMSQSFSESLGLQSARQGHEATLLKDRTVLITGGTWGGNSGTPLDTAEIYDPLTGRGYVTVPMRSRRYGHTATRLNNDRVLIAGGTNDAFTAELYLPATKQFVPTTQMRYQRSGHKAIMVPSLGMVFVLGGYSPQPGQKAHLEAYDVAADQWNDIGEFPGAADVGQTMTLLPDNTLLITGGRISSIGVATKEVFLYTPSTKKWARLTDMLSPREYHLAALTAGRRVVLVSIANVSEYPQATGDSEIYVPYSVPLPGGPARFTPGVALVSLANGNVLATGGTYRCFDAFGIPLCGTISEATAKVFDAKTLTWQIVPSMLATRAYHTATLLANESVLITGGQNYLNGYLFLQWQTHSSIELWNKNMPTQCGELVTVHAGVASYYNGSAQGSTRSCGNEGRKGADGFQWQCVEFIRRFYRLTQGCVSGQPCDSKAWNGKGDAWQYFDRGCSLTYTPATDFGLVRHGNNCGSEKVCGKEPSVARPAVNDIVVWCKVTSAGACAPSSRSVGHVAIIKRVQENMDNTLTVEFIEQNIRLGDAKWNPVVVVTHNSDGTWSFPKRVGYTVRGWLRVGQCAH